MKVDYDLYYKDSGSVNKGHYVESNESVSISLSHEYTTSAKAAGGFKQLHNNLCMSFWMASEGIVFLYCSYVCNCAKIPNFANCRFSFHKLQIFISFRFVPFRFANYSKPCERSSETASFCLKFWLFLSRRPRKLILSIFSKSKRPFEKQTAHCI